MADKPVELPKIDETAIAEQAARWHAVLKSAGPKELEELAAWLKMSPRHGYHFLHAAAVDRLLGRMDLERTKFAPHAWVKEAQENIVPLRATPAVQARSPSAPGSRGRFILVRMAATAMALALVVIGGLSMAAHRWGWQEFSTQPGEQQSVELEDGSIINLDAGSQVRVHLTQTARDVRLVEGQALFRVHHDARRPFRVHTPGGIIQAVGTAFTVNVRNDSAEVSVIEGAVRITSKKASAGSNTFAAGQNADISSRGDLRRRAAAQAPAVMGSLQRRLVFHADALADMVAEFNRYNLAPKFRLEGVEGYARHYTGTFDADDPDAFASVLAQENVYSIERTSDEIIVRKNTLVERVPR